MEPHRHARAGTTIVTGQHARIYLATSQDTVFDVANFLGVSWTFGYLSALAALVGLVAIGGLLLYLETRQRTRTASYALGKRMGLTRATHLRSLLAELGVLLGLAWVIGAGLAWAAVLLVYHRLDIDPTRPPTRCSPCPWPRSPAPPSPSPSSSCSRPSTPSGRPTARTSPGPAAQLSGEPALGCLAWAASPRPHHRADQGGRAQAVGHRELHRLAGPPAHAPPGQLRVVREPLGRVRPGGGLGDDPPGGQRGVQPGRAEHHPDHRVAVDGGGGRTLGADPLRVPGGVRPVAAQVAQQPGPQRRRLRRRNQLGRRPAADGDPVLAQLQPGGRGALATRAGAELAVGDVRGRLLRRRRRGEVGLGDVEPVVERLAGGGVQGGQRLQVGEGRHAVGGGHEVDVAAVRPPVPEAAEPVTQRAVTKPGSAASTASRRSVTRADTAGGSGIRTL